MVRLRVVVVGAVVVRYSLVMAEVGEGDHRLYICLRRWCGGGGYLGKRGDICAALVWMGGLFFFFSFFSVSSYWQEPPPTSYPLVRFELVWIGLDWLCLVWIGFSSDIS